MRGQIAVVLALFGYSAAVAQGLPALPNTGFISGRPAKEKDVVDGNAIFVAKVGGAAVGKPIKIVIPQYAYLVGNDQKPILVVVVQAEEANGIKLFGVRDATGKERVTTSTDLQLLGIKPPE